MSYLALAKKAEERLKGAQAIEGGKIHVTALECLAASVLAENEPDEASSILAIWEEAFDITLDRERVAKHLEHLRQWQSRWAR